MKKSFDPVAAYLESQFPDARFQTESFASGAATMLVSVGDKHWSLEFLPREGFGASPLFGDERDWLGGHRHLFQTPDQLIAWLQGELRHAESPLSLAA